MTRETLREIIGSTLFLLGLAALVWLGLCM